MPDTARPLAVVIGASSGIGYDWAKCCARNNYDLIVSADDPEILDTAKKLKDYPVDIEPVEANLGTIEGVDKLVGVIKNRNVAALLIYAGEYLGKNFLNEDIQKLKHIIDTNITGTLYIIQTIVRKMIASKSGLILIAGAINEQMPMTFAAVDSGINAFLNSFAIALRKELKNSGVMVTCLTPGDTGTQFLERLKEEGVEGETLKKYNPANLANMAFMEMMKGGNEVLKGWQNMMQATMASFVPTERSPTFQRQTEEKFNPNKKSGFMRGSSQGSESPCWGSRSEGLDRDEEGGRSKSQEDSNNPSTRERSASDRREHDEDRYSRGGYGRSFSRRVQSGEERLRDEEGRFISEENKDEGYRSSSRDRRSYLGEGDDARSRGRSSLSRRESNQERPRNEEGRFMKEDDKDKGYRPFSRGIWSRGQDKEDEDKLSSRSRSRGGSSGSSSDDDEEKSYSSSLRVGSLQSRGNHNDDDDDDDDD